MTAKNQKKLQQKQNTSMEEINGELTRHLRKEVVVEFVRAKKRLKQAGRLKSIEKGGIMLKDREENIWINFNAKSEIIRQITLVENGKVVYQQGILTALRR